MHPVIFNESFSFSTRNDLERLQPLSRLLLNMIIAGSKVLPLRPIDRVDMGRYKTGDKIQIFVEESATGRAPKPDYEASTDDGDFAETFRRLQHTCIKNFNFGIRDSPFMLYWKSEEAAVFTVVSIYFDGKEAKDYDVLDTIVNHLRPTTMDVHVKESSWNENGYNEEKLELLARESFLNNLQNCRLIVWDGAFPPPSFILEEPGYAKYELQCE
ncbi:hypothetical protein AAVH_09519 [Aphelenchoides avenae]|nr:hypothetical protein AAVH_09519 [Aphelenchus avenae]